MACWNKIWRLIALWLAKETTAWTEWTPFVYFPMNEAPLLKPIVEYTKNEMWVGRIEDNIGWFVSQRASEVAVSWYVGHNTFWHIMTALFWASTSPATIETWVYKHSFTLQNDNCHQSYSAVTIVWTTQNLTLYNLLDNIEIKAEVWGMVEFSSLYKWQEVNSTTGKTASYTNENYFKVANMHVKFADSVTNLDSATDTVLQNINLSFNKNVMQLYKVWSYSPNSIHNQQFWVTWDMEMMADSSTFKDYVTSWTTRAMRITIQWDSLLWATEYPELSFTFSLVSFEEWDRATDNNAILTQTVGFWCWYDRDEAFEVTWYLQNWQSTQY